MYKSTYDGNIDEIKFVQHFNSNKNLYKNYLSHFKKYNNVWMTRVTTKQWSHLSNKKVFTRSDCYLVDILYDIQTLLKDNNYYLSEDILLNNNITYKKIPYSGISIKMTTSKNFQILKIGPKSFNTLFKSYELGAGASLFCQNKIELEKNDNLITGWQTDIKKMMRFYQNITSNDDKFYLNKETCKKIKNYACKKIKYLIENSHDLQKKIFNGIGLYNEPYTAFYFYHGQNILELKTIPFNVTTGSGRSKGEYTIVLKP